MERSGESHSKERIDRMMRNEWIGAKWEMQGQPYIRAYGLEHPRNLRDLVDMR